MKNDTSQCPDDIVPWTTPATGLGQRGEQIGHLRHCGSCRRELAIVRAFEREFVACVEVDHLACRAAAAVVSELERSGKALARRSGRGAS
jgi:hypothetical protein